MSETRTYIVPEQPQQNPNDNLAMMAMLNGNGGFGGMVCGTILSCTWFGCG